MLLLILVLVIFLAYIIQRKTRERFEPVTDNIVAMVKDTNTLTQYLSKLVTMSPIVYPAPTSEWSIQYSNTMRKICIDALSTFFNQPSVVFIFSQQNFQGELIIIPFTSTLTVKSVPFDKYLTTSLFSCIVPEKTTITFEFTNKDTLKLTSGYHSTLVAPSMISSLLVSPTANKLG
jgi:hypothetical protein